MGFRITGLAAEDFAHLFALSDKELTAHEAVRRIADERSPGYPCASARLIGSDTGSSPI